MTAPSNANTSGLEVVDLNGLLHQAWERLHRSDADVPGALVVLNALHVALEAPLVTAASAQARIAELDEQLVEAAMMIIGSTSRATAAEARADRLAKALETLLSYDEQDAGCIPTDAHLDAQNDARAALQQETQP